MKKIIFVCLGNICRSPVAEGIMLHLKEKYQLDVEIDSAGTASYHIGEAPDRRTIANAAKHGIDLTNLRARQFEVKDFDKFDWILAMDINNMNTLKRMTVEQKHLQKIKLMLDFAHSFSNAEVPDPYYGTEKDFELVFNLVNKACRSIVNQISTSN